MVAFFHTENDDYPFDNEPKSDAFEGFRFNNFTNVAYLAPLSKVNIFIGANNSGKSRFMRAIIKENSIVRIKNHNIIEKLRQLKRLRDKIKETFPADNIIEFYTQLNIKASDELFLNKEHKRLVLNNNTRTVHTVKKDDIIDRINYILSCFYTVRGGRLTSTLERYADSFELIGSILNLSNKQQTPTGDFPFSGLSSTLSYTILTQDEEVIQTINELIDSTKSISEFEITLEQMNKIYIPILRSARTLHVTNLFTSEIDKRNSTEIASSIFELTISEDYKINTRTNKVQIETGLNLFNLIKDANNSKQEHRKPFRGFTKFISENFFNGKHVELVSPPAEENERENIAVEIDGEERAIQYLGDGIQSLLIILYPIFMAKNDSWIFIEEPEIHLHPGLQRIFLNTIINNETIKQKNLTIFFTTHSNHLLNISLEERESTNIFTFEKIKDNNQVLCDIRSVKSQDLDILNQLEINNSSVFLSNCSVWVEGPTDRIYLRIYLNNYIKEFHKPILHEDLHYSFFEYAGSNLSHYIFHNTEESNQSEIEKVTKAINALSIANRIFLVADSDSGKENKHTLLTSKNSKNFSYFRIPVREIENLLSPQNIRDITPKALKKVKKSDMQSISIVEDEYKDKYMGDYLKSIIPEDKLPKNFTAESGTLSTSHKNSFARHAIEAVSWNTMSAHSQQLAEALYNFISTHNYL